MVKNKNIIKTINNFNNFRNDEYLFTIKRIIYFSKLLMIVVINNNSTIKTYGFYYNSVKLKK